MLFRSSLPATRGPPLRSSRDSGSGTLLARRHAVGLDCHHFLGTPPSFFYVRQSSPPQPKASGSGMWRLKSLVKRCSVRATYAPANAHRAAQENSTQLEGASSAPPVTTVCNIHIRFLLLAPKGLGLGYRSLYCVQGSIFL